MAKAVITNIKEFAIRNVTNAKYFVSSIIFEKRSIRIEDKSLRFGLVKSKSYPISSISYPRINAQVSDTLPFRVKFINIGIESYGPNNPPPIGIAVIGVNNYIL